MQYWIAQIIGVMVIACSVLSYQQKERKRILLFLMVAQLLSMLQLLCLNAVTGACLDLISFARTLIFSRNKDKKWASSGIWLYGFAAVMIVTGILTWDNIFSVFAIMGSVLSTFALWMTEEKKIRRISMLVGPCWIVYCIANGAVAGAVNELIAMASIMIGMLRHDRKMK